MPPRSSWKGYLKLSLVAVPVKAYTATSSEAGGIPLHQLHDECHSRIKYVKTCPIHGPVSNDEIVSGYEYSKGQYVVIDPKELDLLRTEGDKAVNVQSLVHEEEVDPVYYSGRTYYLVPDGPIGQKPYALIHEGLEQGKLCGIAQVVMSGKEQLVLIRPLEKLLAMSVLNFDAEVKKPEAFQDELTPTTIGAEELKLTQTILNAYVQQDFDLSQYKDTYTEKLTALIQAKVEGKELVTPPAPEEPHVINLMDALRKSVKQVQEARGGPSAGEKAAPRPAARSTGAAASRKRAAPSTARRKKKSG